MPLVHRLTSLNKGIGHPSLSRNLKKRKTLWKVIFMPSLFCFPWSPLILERDPLDSNIEMRRDSEEFPIAWDSLRKSTRPSPCSKGNHVTPPSCTMTLSQEQIYITHCLLTVRPNMAVYVPLTALGGPFSTRNSLSFESPSSAGNLTGPSESRTASLASNTACKNQGPTICSTCS